MMGGNARCSGRIGHGAARHAPDRLDAEPDGLPGASRALWVDDGTGYRAVARGAESRAGCAVASGLKRQGNPNADYSANRIVRQIATGLLSGSESADTRRFDSPCAGFLHFRPDSRGRARRPYNVMMPGCTLS